MLHLDAHDLQNFSFIFTFLAKKLIFIGSKFHKFLHQLLFYPLLVIDFLLLMLINPHIFLLSFSQTGSLQNMLNHLCLSLFYLLVTSMCPWRTRNSGFQVSSL